MLGYFVFPIIVLCGTGGELCVSRAMKSVGEARGFHPAELLRVAGRAIREPWMWAGVSMMALAFFALLGALSAWSVSFVVPVTALDYVAAALGSVVFLHEQVSPRRWLGLSFVILGVALVFLSKS
ncbi:MAG: EamA family transporter [Acidobacteriaceae bacterium]